MAWQIEFSQRAARDLQSLDPPLQRRVLSFLRQRIAPADDPRSTGKALTSDFAGRWRYRVGKLRLICQIEDTQGRVLVLLIGQRGEIYR